MTNFFQNIKTRISALIFLLGFLIDNFTLTRVDQLFDNLIILFYLFLASVSILISSRREEIFNEQNTFSNYVTQFAFGGLFSAFVIFYTKSATLAFSWPFLLFIYVFFIGSEKFKKIYEKTTFKTSVLFLCILSYTTFSVPIIVKSIDLWVFLLSGFISLLVIHLFIKILKKIRESGFATIYFFIFTIYIVFNAMYFTNIIPPIPLSPKESGVYNWAGVDEIGKYKALKPVWAWYQSWEYLFNNLYIKKGENAYFYISVFSPTNINTEITHKWEYWSELKNNWVLQSKISYFIKGGRERGYKGWSFITSPIEGDWRITVANPRGQVIKSTNFKIIYTDEKPKLQWEILK